MTRHIIQIVSFWAPSFLQPINCTLGQKKRQGKPRTEGGENGEKGGTWLRRKTRNISASTEVTLCHFKR